MELNPEQLKEWTDFLWSIGSRGLIVFAVIYYRELVVHIGKGLFDTIFSWLKRK